MHKGNLKAIAAIAGVMENAANVGVGLLIAYVVEMAWVTSRFIPLDKKAESRTGILLGIGFCGLLGVATSLFTAAHLAAGHANALDRIGLSWVVVSLGVLGFFVVLQPGIAMGSIAEDTRAKAESKNSGSQPPAPAA